MLKNYNNQDWSVQIVVNNYLTKNSVTLSVDNVNYISIYNSLESYVPFIEIHYKDYNNELLKNLTGNRHIYCNKYATACSNKRRK